MNTQIPIVVEEFYHLFVTEPNPRFWPDHLQDTPIQGHGLWSFYQGLCLGLQLSQACLETQ